MQIDTVSIKLILAYCNLLHAPLLSEAVMGYNLQIIRVHPHYEATFNLVKCYKTATSINVVNCASTLSTFQL